MNSPPLLTLLSHSSLVIHPLGCNTCLFIPRLSIHSIISPSINLAIDLGSPPLPTCPSPAFIIHLLAHRFIGLLLVLVKPAQPLIFNTGLFMGVCLCGSVWLSFTHNDHQLLHHLLHVCVCVCVPSLWLIFFVMICESIMTQRWLKTDICLIT